MEQGKQFARFDLQVVAFPLFDRRQWDRFVWFPGVLLGLSLIEKTTLDGGGWVMRIGDNLWLEDQAHVVSFPNDDIRADCGSVRRRVNFDLFHSLPILTSRAGKMHRNARGGHN